MRPNGMNGYPLAMHLVSKCGAKNRRGTPCQAPKMKGKTRCRMHGGKATGRPRTHGLRTKEAMEQRRQLREAAAKAMALLKELG